MRLSEFDEQKQENPTKGRTTAIKSGEIRWQNRLKCENSLLVGKMSCAFPIDFAKMHI